MSKKTNVPEDKYETKNVKKKKHDSQKQETHNTADTGAMNIIIDL